MVKRGSRNHAARAIDPSLTNLRTSGTRGELQTKRVIHRDPWDRLLAAQAIVENMAILSSDEKLSALGAKRVW